MSVYLDDPDVTLHHGEALETLRAMPDASVDCCITSPPYYGLRDYGTGDAQIGLEDTPAAFIDRLVAVFAEVRRVLAPSGTCWLNMGDSYAHSLRQAGDKHAGAKTKTSRGVITEGYRPLPAGMKEKNLLMIPARLAIALQDDGWYLRSDVIWAKPNPMPESVTDRPTSAHEHLFLLTRSPRYWYDAEAIREPHKYGGVRPSRGAWAQDEAGRPGPDGAQHLYGHEAGRNARNVWTIATQPFPEAHFAVMPEELARRALVAGCPAQVCRECGEPRVRMVERVSVRERARMLDGGKAEALKESGQRNDGLSSANSHNGQCSPQVSTLGWSDCGHDAYRPGTVLDPFVGAGTVAKVARDNGRRAVGVDLSADYLAIAARRLQQLSLLGGAA